MVQQVIMLFDRTITGMLHLVGSHNDALPLFITWVIPKLANMGETKHRIGCSRPQKCTLK